MEVASMEAVSTTAEAAIPSFEALSTSGAEILPYMR